MNKIEGFLFINKPKGANSFRCVAQIRRVLGQKKLKVGYAGTLDPFAHGLMIIGIGRKATRLLHHITKWDKQYIATAKLGELTDTLDPTGTIIATNTITVSKYDLHQTIANFPKTYEQTPPIYCALKHKGVPLYKLARHKGKTEQDLQEVLHKKSRTVHLHSIELLNAQKPFFTIQTHVSHGTYIRTLVRYCTHTQILRHNT